MRRARLGGMDGKDDWGETAADIALRVKLQARHNARVATERRPGSGSQPGIGRRGTALPVKSGLAIQTGQAA